MNCINFAKRKPKVVSLFVGIGGIDLAFKQAGAEISWANEIDKNACQTYRINFPNHQLIEGDIKQINVEEISNFDILIAGFPCQAFSVAGIQGGFKDKRGLIFFEIIRFLKAKKPKAFLLENVRNIINHNQGKSFQKILNSLKECSYLVKYQVLNSYIHGNIPQNRERVLIVGFLNLEQYNNFSFPEEIPLEISLKDLIDFENPQEKKYYYSAKHHDFYNHLEEKIIKEDVIYQWRRIYVRENKSNVCPTLTANLGTGGHNVPLIFTKHGIRKLTPRECFNLQGFSSTFKLPNLANCHLYKQAGNSVTIPLIKRVAINILKALERNSYKKLH